MGVRRGDFILVHTPGSLICKLIRIVTDSHWNHIAWVYDNEKAIEAQGDGGVRFKPLSEYALDDKALTKVLRIKEGHITECELSEALGMARRARGSRYDWLLLLSLLWLYITGSRKRKEARDWNCGWICSELIAKPLWECAGFKVREDVPVDNIVPADFQLSKRIKDAPAK